MDKGNGMRREMVNVITYRVYEISEELCSMEVFVMKYEDELRFYQEGRTDYLIQANAYIERIDYFHRQMQEKCRIHGYNYPAGSSLEDINAFLENHYFVQVRKYTEDVGEILNRLNRMAEENHEEYIQRFFESGEAVITTPAEIGVDGTLLQKVHRTIGDGISKVECMNVGQANFSIGYDAGDHPKVVFDAGIQYYRKKLIRQKVSALSQEDLIVVISHYDFDHIKGYHYLMNSAKERIWILPEPRKNLTPLERNLLSQLIIRYKRNTVFLKNINYGTVKFDMAKHTLKIGNIRIYQGNEKKKDGNQSTAENARSLMCEIAGKKTALLPADALYLEFPKAFSPDYLVVPHHSCNYTKPIPSKILDRAHLEKVIVFAGKHDGYCHPNLTQLHRLGFAWNDSRIVYLLKTPGLFLRKTQLKKKVTVCPDSYIMDLW